jgi:hypothetical protein
MRNICGKQYIVRCVVNGSRRKTFKWTPVKQKGTQLTSLPPGGQQSALLPAPLPGPRSWQPAACSSKPRQKPPPPPQPVPSRPAWLHDPKSCLPRSSHLQSALFEALLAVPNSSHPPGGHRSALPLILSYFPLALPSPMAPLTEELQPGILREEMFTVFSMPLDQLMQWPKTWQELSLPARSLNTNRFLANSKEREKQHKTSSAIGWEIIIEDDGHLTAQNPYSTNTVLPTT